MLSIGAQEDASKLLKAAAVDVQKQCDEII